MGTGRFSAKKRIIASPTTCPPPNSPTWAISKSLENDTTVNETTMNGMAVNGTTVNETAVNGMTVNGMTVDFSSPVARFFKV